MMLIQKTKTTYGDLYAQTIKKRNALKARGYNVISIWESDYYKMKSEQ